MTFDELGTGYETADMPAGTPGGLRSRSSGRSASVQITSGTSLAGSVTFPSAGGDRHLHAPRRRDGHDRPVGHRRLRQHGRDHEQSPDRRRRASQAITFTLPASTVQAVQGQAFSLTGSVTDTKGYSPYYLTANYGDGTVDRLGGYAVTSFTASHAYANAGDYTVTLTFTDSMGNTRKPRSR